MSFGTGIQILLVHNAVRLKQGLLHGIQQNLESVSFSDIDGFLYQENISKEELDHAIQCQYFFGKKGLRCYGSKMEIEILLFPCCGQRRNNSSGIHRLWIDNEVTKDPKLIEDDHVLEFYKKIYADSISNVLDTSNMED